MFTRKPETVEALAAQLAESEELQKARIAAARADHAATRASVIERG